MSPLRTVPNVDDMTRDAERKRRLAIFGGIVLITIVVVAVVIATSSGGNSSSSSTGNLKGTTAIHNLFAGIPQKGNTLGSSNAPATMMVFADLQCPFCAQFENGALPAIVNKYVRPGKLKVVFQPIAIIGQDSILGARASAAAASQNKMFNFNAVLYRNQGEENTGYLDSDYVKKIATGAGVNPSKITSNLNSAYADKILGDAQSAATSGHVNSTPTFFVAKKGKSFEQLQVTSLDPSAFYGKLDQLTS
jgi:protein-disulfide isomerase